MNKPNQSFYGPSLDFEVAKLPVVVKLGDTLIDVPSKKGITNLDTKEVISVMSNGYRLFNNAEFTALANRISETFNLEIDHFASHKGGRNVLVAFRNDKPKNILGHQFNENIVLYDNRSGNKKLCLGGVGTIHRCSNMFPSTKVQLSLNHSSKMDEMLAEWEMSMELFQLNQELHIRDLEKLGDIPVNKNNLYDFIGGWVDLTQDQIRQIAYNSEVKEVSDHNGERFAVSTKKRNTVQGLIDSYDIERKELGDTAFTLWNGVTHYFSNTKKKQELDLLFGQFGQKERKVIEFAKQLV